MLFNFPFKFPYFYNNFKYPKQPASPIRNDISCKEHIQKKDSENIESSESFFEIFDLKLYFDDILIICILLFLYSEKIQDEELFICLILLLIT